ncbi:hypothetical protein Tco_0431201 [Tanacetum coccineum]|uniref:Uncharacterized protein n=1 Tax=Tanacetum coccineum TaxID=301880 RepID=A0ABQ5BIM3_9ASTR
MRQEAFSTEKERLLEITVVEGELLAFSRVPGHFIQCHDNSDDSNDDFCHNHDFVKRLLFAEYDMNAVGMQLPHLPHPHPPSQHNCLYWSNYSYNPTIAKLIAAYSSLPTFPQSNELFYKVDKTRHRINPVICLADPESRYHRTNFVQPAITQTLTVIAMP